MWVIEDVKRDEMIGETDIYSPLHSIHLSKVAMEVLHHNKVIMVNHQCNNKICLAYKLNKHPLVKSTVAVDHALHAV